MKSCSQLKSLTLLMSLVLLTAFSNCTRRGPNERYVAPDNEFSYLPPRDWTLIDYPGLKYQAAIGSSVDGFAPNINITETIAEVSLDDFIDEEVKTIPQLAAQEGNKGFSFLSQSKFVTESQQNGRKLMFLREERGRLLRHSIYVFEGNNNKKFIVTGTAPADGGEAYDQVFDNSIKTFKVGSP